MCHVKMKNKVKSPHPSTHPFTAQKWLDDEFGKCAWLAEQVPVKYQMNTELWKDAAQG